MLTALMARSTIMKFCTNVMEVLRLALTGNEFSYQGRFFNLENITVTPLREVWDVCINTTDARLIAEFMALANHHGGVRDEVIVFIEASRGLQVASLEKSIAEGGNTTEIPADAIAIIGASLALTLNRGGLLGATRNHVAIKELIQAYLQRLEG